MDDPTQLLSSLLAIFPDFGAEWEPGEVPETRHSVMLRFAPYFGRRAAALPEGSLKALGDLINREVEAGGPREDAVATCFLEHLNPGTTWKALKPYLSGSSRRASRP